MLVKVDGKLPRGCTRQGHRAGDHRQDRHRRRHRLHDRVRRLGDPRARHGRPHDGLQHGDRGRRARRPGGGRRDDDRLRARAVRSRPTGVEWEQAVAYWRTLHSDPGAHFDAVVELDAAQDQSAGHLGHVARDGASAIDDRVPDPDKEKDASKRDAIERALAYMGLEPNKAHRPTSASTRSSSARAPTPASRTCARPRPWCASSAREGRQERQAGDGRARAPAW